MKTLETTCIMCPIGCRLTVLDSDIEVKVCGNGCPRGEKYGEQELLDPRRTVTTLVRTADGRVVTVKTSEPIQKNLIKKALLECADILIDVPVKIGDILLKNVAGSGASLLATKNIF